MARRKKKTFGPCTITRVLKVNDGDTFKVDIDHVSPLVGRDIAVRIRGIDTPEIRCNRPREKELAIRARTELQTIFDVADKITLSNIERGKYFRLIADVFADGVNVASMLIEANVARHYTGGTRGGWL